VQGEASKNGHLTKRTLTKLALNNQQSSNQRSISHDFPLHWVLHQREEPSTSTGGHERSWCGAAVAGRERVDGNRVEI